MKQNKNWKDVIDCIEMSGVNQQQNLRRDNLQRYLHVQRELEDRIAESNDRKNQLAKEKAKERQYIQMKLKQEIEGQRMRKLRNRQKQQKLRSDNLEIMNKQKTKSENSESGFAYNENPITANLFNKNLIRQRQRKGANKIYEQQNLRIVQGKLTEKMKQKNNREEQANMFKIHIEQDFRKREEERQRFKARCLENGSYGLVKQSNANETFQKQYSHYLDQQIDSKFKGQHNKSKTQKVQDILDGQLEKLNYNPQQQSASPAYLGRIAYNHDRKKQLQYLDKQASRHTRVKTQLPSIDSLSTRIKQLQPHKTPYTHNSIADRQQNFQQSNKPPVSSRNESQNRNYQRLKSYKQMNIATGQIITKNYL